MSTNLVSLVRDLQRRKGRKRRGLGVAEGVRLVEEALAAGVPFRGAVTDPTLRDTPRGAALAQSLADHAVPVEEVSAKELSALADTDTPQGVLAVVEPPRWTLVSLEVRPHQPVLVLDGVQDPGNVGTLVRTAFALGASAAVLLKGTADLSNAKVMRGGMGATFRLPTAPADEKEFARWVADREVTVWASAGDGTPLERVGPPERLAVVVGNEGAGVRPFIKSLAAHQVSVPLARGAESLNVAVAAGIILYDVRHRG
jgi:TrmH family RNA methyltransferase